MKKQIFNQTINLLILTVILFVYVIHGLVYAELAFEEGAATVREIAENTPKHQSIGLPLRYSAVDVEGCIDISLRGPDANTFDIVLPFRGGVQLKTRSALNYERKNSYIVILSIIDSENPCNYDVIWVDITVTNVNEKPVFSEEMDEATVNRVHRSIPENTPVGINIGPPVTATDPDGSEIVLTYSLSGYDADMFEINAQTGQLITKMPLDYEAFECEPRTYFVDVEVSDGVTTATTEVWIDVEPVNEFAPMFIEGDTTTREIISTEEIGVNIGSPVSAIDLDAGETITYSLSDGSPSVFAIDSRTGQLRSSAELDYKIKLSYTLKIIASDGIHSDSIDVTVLVISDKVEVPDRSLARMIRLTLRLDPGEDITQREMSELVNLEVDGNTNTVNLINFIKIIDLTGLEHATNLRTLILTTNHIRDLTPLSGLNNLTTLDLHRNHIVSFLPLEGLVSLKKLNLNQNRTNDITPLVRLTNLTELNLRVNSISDISPLKDLTNLRVLDIGFNSIDDITLLKDLSNLTELILDVNEIRDITPIKFLSNLRRLDLGYNFRKDITPLKDLTNLTELILDYNDIRDVTSLEGLSNLKTLDLSNNSHLTDIHPLANLVGLEMLKLKGCPIRDLTPLEGLNAEIDIFE